ncbi:hypothetical protein GF407_10120 [candidate division KSB1 bacterium]|nr:hypothetical protein [candidate division KSB1 bacterium]
MSGNIVRNSPSF